MRVAIMIQNATLLPITFNKCLDLAAKYKSDYMFAVWNHKC